jgi:hypothetical protein
MLVCFIFMMLVLCAYPKPIERAGTENGVVMEILSLSKNALNLSFNDSLT